VVCLADGRFGLVKGIEFVSAPQIIYNLSVSVAHTYFVVDGQWLFHKNLADSLRSTVLKNDGGGLRRAGKKKGKVVG
jgi:hypothetical protein